MQVERALVQRCCSPRRCHPAARSACWRPARRGPSPASAARLRGERTACCAPAPVVRRTVGSCRSTRSSPACRRNSQTCSTRSPTSAASAGRAYGSHGLARSGIIQQWARWCGMRIEGVGGPTCGAHQILPRRTFPREALLGLPITVRLGGRRAGAEPEIRLDDATRPQWATHSLELRCWPCRYRTT